MRYLPLIALTVLTGCATALTPQGASVILVESRADNQCSFIGTVSGSNTMGMSMAHDADGAINQMRNKASHVNANAVRVISINSNESGTTAVGEALRCKL